MQGTLPRYAILGFSLCVILSSAAQSQTDSAKTFKANCVMCHAANGSGDSPAGKALQAKDLRSAAVQKQSDATLAAVITNGKDKMPAFSEKLQPSDIKKLVAYVRSLGKKK